MRAYNWSCKDSSIWFDLDHVLGVNTYYDRTGRLSVMLFMAFRDGPLYLPRYEESTLPPEKMDGMTNDEAAKCLKDRFEKLKEMDNTVMEERIADLRHAWTQGK